MLSPSRLLDPALLVLVGLVVGLVLSSTKTLRDTRRRVRVGALLAWGAWLTGWLLASPWFASRLARSLEPPAPDLGAVLAGSDAARRVLVVLSGGARPAGNGISLAEQLEGNSTDRVIGAARIYREQGFGHVIVTGRGADEAPGDLAGAMAELLVLLGVPRDRIHLEAEARDTKENAIFSTRIIRTLPVDRVVVVTTAIHMRRAVWEFGRAGLTVVAAPVDYEPPPAPGLGGLLPSSGALSLSHRCLHELVGRLKP